MAFKEAITWFGDLDHATGCRVDAETVPMRAYVTGSDDAREARFRARYGLTPHRVASSMARDTRAARRPSRCTHRHRRRSRVGSDEDRRRLRFSAGATATQVATLKAAGGAMVPVVSTGTHEANSTRTDSRAAPATLRLHLGVSILRQAQDRYVVLGRLSVHDRGNKDNVAWLL